MKFIFPQNYNFKNKILGIIDYSVAIFNILWDLFIIFLLHFIFLIIFGFPVLLLSISGIHGENLIYILIYFFKFLFKQKIIFYTKTNKIR